MMIVSGFVAILPASIPLVLDPDHISMNCCSSFDPNFLCTVSKYKINISGYWNILNVLTNSYI